MGDQEQEQGTTETAATRLRLLQEELVTPRVRPRDTGARRAPAVTSTEPLNLGLLDHITRCFDEVINHTRAEAPDVGPPPAELPDVYDWMWEHTGHEGEKALVRAAMVYRQSLEHALRDDGPAGADETVIRRIPCPRCKCWSLFWRPTQQRAWCAYGKCNPRGGRSQWTLAQLAEQEVRTNSRRAAT